MKFPWETRKAKKAAAQQAAWTRVDQEAPHNVLRWLSMGIGEAFRELDNFRRVIDALHNLKADKPEQYGQIFDDIDAILRPQETPKDPAESEAAG